MVNKWNIYLVIDLLAMLKELRTCPAQCQQLVNKICGFCVYSGAKQIRVGAEPLCRYLRTKGIVRTTPQ